MSKGLIFTYLLTYGGAFVSLFSPYIGLLIYVCFAIVRPDSMWSFSVPAGNYSRFVAVALLVGWGIQCFAKWSAATGNRKLLAGFGAFLLHGLLSGVALLIGWPLREFGRAQLVLCLLVSFWLWAVLGLLFAEDTEVAYGFVSATAKIVVIFLVGLTTIDSTAKLKQLAWVIILSQGFVALQLNLTYLDGYNQLLEEGFGEMDNNCNAIAMVTCVGLAFFLGMISERWWQKLLAFALALLMVHVVMFSFSRGGLLALTVVGLVSFFLIPQRPVYYVVFVIAALLAVRLAGPQVQERFFTTFADSGQRDPSAESRLVLWSNCWDSMEKHPLLGVGPDHWPLIVHKYGWPRGKEAHTLWLQLGAELGIPGLLLLLGFYGCVVWRLFPLMYRSDLPDPWLGHVGRMVIPSLLGFMVAAQFVSLKGLELPYYIALLGAGALKLTSQPLTGVRSTTAQRRLVEELPSVDATAA